MLLPPLPLHAHHPPPLPPFLLSPSADTTIGCPADVPAFYCDNIPLCFGAGQPVNLSSACWPSMAGVTLTYLVSGAPATAAACPSVGTLLPVQVQPRITSKPSCVYNAANAFSLVSEFSPQYLSPHTPTRVCSRSGAVCWLRFVNSMHFTLS